MLSRLFNYFYFILFYLLLIILFVLAGICLPCPQHYIPMCCSLLSSMHVCFIFWVTALTLYDHVCFNSFLCNAGRNLSHQWGCGYPGSHFVYIFMSLYVIFKYFCIPNAVANIGALVGRVCDVEVQLNYNAG